MTNSAAKPKTDLLADGLLDVPEAARFLGVSKTFLYNEMERGRLQYVKLGRCRRIPKRALLDYAGRGVRGGWAIGVEDPR